MQFWSRVSVSYPSALFDGDSYSADPAVIRPNNDLTVQLTSRKEKISFLIKFINENGVIGKVGVLLLTPICFFILLYRCPSAAANASQLMQKNSTLLNNYGFVSMKPFCRSNISCLIPVTYYVPQTRASLRHLK